MKILHNFKVHLSMMEGERVAAKWRKFGENGGAMFIAQPIIDWGPFNLHHKVLNCAILDAEAMQRISAVLEDCVRDEGGRK